jgi:SAM-dependent methyltransferase
VPASRDLPYPPASLATRVFGLDGWGDPLAAYEEVGAQTKSALVDLLPADWTWEGKRVLDFGSGAGRTLRHFLTEAETAEFWGADIDEASITWLRENLCPPLNAWKCAFAPPLGLQLGSFDLAWAISVFTHLTDTSSSWLLELHRLLKPGGLLIATYMGRWTSEFTAGEPWEQDRIGRNVVKYNENWDTGGPAVLMSDWWVRAHWGRAFEILEIAPQIQEMSWALLRRRDVTLTTEGLEKPADDPREYRALRHNLRHVEGELLKIARREQEVRRQYEDSLSWKVTRPLRAGATRMRTLRGRVRARAASRGGRRQ